MIKSKVYYAISLSCFITLSAMAMLDKQPDSGRETQHINVDGNPTPSVKLVVTSADWCGPCKVLAKTTATLGKAGYSIETKTNNQPNHSVPRLQWFRFGQLERTEYGNLPKEEIISVFEEIEDKVFHQ